MLLDWQNNITGVTSTTKLPNILERAVILTYKDSLKCSTKFLNFSMTANEVIDFM